LQYKEVSSDSLPNTAPISLNSLHLQTILLCFLFYIDHQADYDMKISL
jgi:succinate-acetate transporter protein